MPSEKRVVMIGIGLIGSSLSLAIKESSHNVRLVGYSDNHVEMAGAKTLGMIDEYELHLEDAVKEADIIFLCTPVSTTCHIIDLLSNMTLKPNVLISDVGSTKKQVMKQAKKLSQQNVTFIGGHPMAGSHKSGYQAGDKELFENAYYILVTNGDSSRIDELKDILAGTRANFIELSAEEHDIVTGMVSHIPHIIASGLVRQADELSQTYMVVDDLAAGGFRDMTRIASSNSKMWTDILLSNREILLTQLQDMTEVLHQVETWLKLSNKDAIANFFEQAKKKRDNLPLFKEGAISSFHDLFGNVPDVPGSISKVTGLLASANISIMTIKIIEARDDLFGVLQLSFKTEKDRLDAQIILTENTNYTWFIR
ncbi:MAG: prephenate dehydrogenase [Vagococcus sp.]